MCCVDLWQSNYFIRNTHMHIHTRPEGTSGWKWNPLSRVDCLGLTVCVRNRPINRTTVPAGCLCKCRGRGMISSIMNTMYGAFQLSWLLIACLTSTARNRKLYGWNLGIDFSWWFGCKWEFIEYSIFLLYFTWNFYSIFRWKFLFLIKNWNCIITGPCGCSLIRTRIW